MVLSIVLACGSLQARDFRPPVIYGKDNRREVYTEPNSDVRKLASSVVAIFSPEYLKEDPATGRHRIEAASYQEFYGLCETERFVAQTAAADCTGFLIGKDLIATAGHCIVNARTCKNLRFVFDYALTSAEDVPEETKRENTYRCREIVAIKDTWTVDYAIIRTDRPVIGRKPLRMNPNGGPKMNEKLFIIGHPSGLPMKIADEAFMRGRGRGFFVANLDSNGGNSGSPVFNARTKMVEGILVRGEEDFIDSGSCKVSLVCPDRGCVGQDVTNIGEVLKHLR